MNIAITYPPLKSRKGLPLLSQNRQFQWTKAQTVVYPVIPASAATLLQENGHKISWLDGIAEGWTYNEWLGHLKKAQPDLIFLETKTPVIKQHWQIIKQLKKTKGISSGVVREKLSRTSPDGGSPKSPPIIILAGDHVTALPQKSFQKSPVDYILLGGHYDTLLLNLVNHLSKDKKLSPSILTRSSRPSKKVRTEGIAQNLDKLPMINRSLTKWHLYAYKNGNFKYTPGTYTMAGRDCWWRKEGGCTFCSWTTIFPQFSYHSVENVLDEIGHLIDLGVKEIFDDTGTFMVGKWLTDFCQGMIKRGYHKKVVMGCNMRFGVLTKKDYRLMAQANFRFLLYGLESANQKTLDRLNKGTKLTSPASSPKRQRRDSPGVGSQSKKNPIQAELETIQQINQTNKGHLEPHVTCMVGYPWETKLQAQNTVDFCKSLFKQGLIDSLQATIIIPYPGTKLFKQADQNGWLLTKNWDRYDMKQPILKSPMTKKEIHHLTQSIYTSALTPQFVWKKLTSIRNWDDLKFLLISGYKFMARLLDFRPNT